MVLVIQFQDKLNNARAINVRVDGAEVRWIIKAKISWNSQADPIPGIECFGPELELALLGERKLLEQRKVKILKSGHAILAGFAPKRRVICLADGGRTGRL